LAQAKFVGVGVLLRLPNLTNDHRSFEGFYSSYRLDLEAELSQGTRNLGDGQTFEVNIFLEPEERYLHVCGLVA
jgi:hypothetical protein